MTIDKMMAILENNYEEIDVYDHVRVWVEELGFGDNPNTVGSICNKEHKLAVQFITRPAEGCEKFTLDDAPIYEICISYKENTDKQICKTFKIIDKLSPEKLYYWDVVNLVKDMGWE